MFRAMHPSTSDNGLISCLYRRPRRPDMHKGGQQTHTTPYFKGASGSPLTSPTRRQPLKRTSSEKSARAASSHGVDNDVVPELARGPEALMQEMSALKLQRRNDVTQPRINTGSRFASLFSWGRGKREESDVLHSDAAALRHPTGT